MKPIAPLPHRSTSPRVKARTYPARQQGLSLVEMMIGLVLGLIVVSAVMNMYAGSSRSSAFSTGLQTMQENGRYGVSVLQRGIRLAGYSPDVVIDPIDIANSDTDKVVVRIRQAFDCNGIDTAPVGGIAVNTYELDAVNQQITCTGNSAAASAMPIVEGVDGFAVLYGIDGTDDDDTPEQYITYDSTIVPRSVSAVRFALLVNSGEPIRRRSISKTYVLLDQEVTYNDQFARHVFTSTVKLRNSL
ncbi:MAG: PilW family protein [Gammaproteobacteria bacterium]|nr:PilW family protein [Gammaproteobacteria bacterium]